MEETKRGATKRNQAVSIAMLFFFFSKFFGVKYVVFISDRVRSKNSYLMHFNTVFPPELASI